MPIEGESSSAERDSLAADLDQSHKMEAVGRLAAGIAHGLNNVLTAILGYTELLLERVSEPDLREDLLEIQRAGERAGALTRQLTTFTRSQVAVLKVLDVNRIVIDLEKLLTKVIREDVRLEIALAQNLAHTRAAAGQIEQVVVNLVVNARDAMPQGGPLWISTSNAAIDADFVRRYDGARIGPHVALAVRDTGLGMPAEAVAHLFEPFYSPRQPGETPRLGMATVHAIVKASGGYVTVESQPGVGTTITAYFPATDAPLDVEVAASEPASEYGTETILLVEDDVPIREWMRRTLSSHGYRVLEARDVPDAVTICRTFPEPIELMISDIVMPGMNGPNLAQHLLTHRPELRVMYVSGFPQSEQVDAALRSAHVTVLSKPFVQAALLAATRQVLGASPTRTT
jgi:two-component system cell cycle sensor histidine kinase/response regulator CckA